MIKTQQIKLVFSVYSILSAGAESRGGISDHLSLMFDAAIKEGKGIIKGFMTFSIRPVVQNKATKISEKIFKGTSIKNPLVFTFFGKISGYVTNDLMMYAVDKVLFLDPGGKLANKEQQEKLRRKNAKDIAELENLFKPKTPYQKLSQSFTKSYNYIQKHNQKITAVISIAGCIGLSNVMFMIMNYSWDGLTNLIGEGVFKPIDNLFGISFLMTNFLKTSLKKYLQLKQYLNISKRNYVIPFLRTQLREIVNLDLIWDKTVKKFIYRIVNYKKSDKWESGENSIQEILFEK